MTVKPVTDWENEEVGWCALSCQTVHEKHLAEVEKLRARHAAYIASLPTDLDDCLIAVAKVLHHDYSGYPEGFEEALNLSFALAPMIRQLNTDEPGPERDALLYIAGRVRQGLERTAEGVQHMSDILDGPDRLRRDERDARRRAEHVS